MIARNRRLTRTRRAVAALCMAVALGSAMPSVARADDFWGLWASEVTKRVWWEMPFAIVVSLPAMVVTTPFWVGTRTPGWIRSARGGGEEEGEE